MRLLMTSHISLARYSATNYTREGLTHELQCHAVYCYQRFFVLSIQPGHDLN